MIRSGQMRHRGTIQQPTEVNSTSGEPVVTWSRFAGRWMSIEPVEGREYFDSQQIIAEATHRMKMRYVEGVTTKMRILFGTRIFDIRSIQNVDERKRETHMMCVEDV